MLLLRLLDLYGLLIFVRIILSWVYPDPYSPVVRFFHAVTDPVLAPLRRIIPPIGGMIDISPMIAILLIQLLKHLIIRSLYY